METAINMGKFEGPQKKLLGLIVFRILTITVLMGSTIILNFRDGQTWTPVQQIIIYSIALVYFLSIFYLLAVQYNTNHTFQAIAQLLMDILFWSCLIYLTGGLHSPFTFLYTLSIIHGAILLGRRGIYLTLFLSIIFFGFVIVFESHEIFHTSLILNKSFTNVFDIHELYQFFLNICMFLMISVLAIFLASQVAESEEILTRERMSLQMQKMLNRSIVAGINSGFVLTDLNGQITFFNVAAERISNKTQQDVLGRGLSEIFPNIANVLDTELSGETWKHYIEIETNESDEVPVWAAFSFSDQTGTDGKRVGLIVIIDDISERRQLEERFFQTQKLAAIGELAAGIAHEIRNPLASISGSIQMLSAESDQDDDNYKLMEIILRETDRLNKLINDFLSYARPNPMMISPVNIREILEDISELLHRDEKTSNVRIRIEYGNNLPEMIGDGGQLSQMLWNLLKNASEASAVRDKGVVWVKIERGPDDEEAVPSTSFSIRDNGEGMNAETKERIFDPFYTTKPSGTGLGLAIVYQIIKGHNGHVEVKSEVGSGTVFKLILPCPEFDTIKTPV